MQRDARWQRGQVGGEAMPPGVTLHVLPTGDEAQPSAGDLRNLRYRNLSGVPDRIDRAYAAAGDYLDRPSTSEGGAAARQAAPCSDAPSPSR